MELASIEDLRGLLNEGGDPNDIIYGKSYLHHCIDEDNGEMVSFLIEKGADPNNTRCTEYLPPLHYAIKSCKNRAVLALLQSQADPNLRLSTNGNVPLITAINSDNDEAVNYLLQFEADPNMANKREEIPLFHAIHKGNYNVVNLLLENHSQTELGTKSALHYSVHEGQAECCLLLLKYGCRKDSRDNHNRRPLDISYNLEDPTIELLISAHNLPETTLDINFIKFLNDSFETKIETLRDEIYESTSKLPKKLKSFISQIINMERIHYRFVNYLKKRNQEYQELIEALSRPTPENLDRDIDRLSVQLRNTFIKQIEYTVKEQNNFQNEFFSPNGIESYERWVKRTENLQKFIDQMVIKGLDEYGLKDDVDAKLRKAKHDKEIVNELLKIAAAKTVPFQEEIVAFVIFSMRQLKTTSKPSEPIDVYERFFRKLLRQIEISNPELIRKQFKRSS